VIPLELHPINSSSLLEFNQPKTFQENVSQMSARFISIKIHTTTRHLECPNNRSKLGLHYPAVFDFSVCSHTHTRTQTHHKVCDVIQINKASTDPSDHSASAIGLVPLQLRYNHQFVGTTVVVS
jgi:hypothetical protein